MEAEYIALTYTAKEAIQFHNFLSELISPIIFPLNIYNDNQSVISLTYAKLGQFHIRTKHINIHFYFICKKIKDGLLEVIYYPTNCKGITQWQP